MSSVDNTFVALDLETTGLDPKSAEIIEIGAVKVENGQLADHFGQLVRPYDGIPLQITRLTGISDEDVKNSPQIQDVLPNLLEFLSTSPVVIHKASFDLSFLREIEDWSDPEVVYDTLELTRVVFPRLIEHKLQSLARFFGIQDTEFHRATADAYVTAQVFLRTIEVLRQKDLDLIQRMLRLIRGTDSSLAGIFISVANELAQMAWTKRIGTINTDPDCLKEFFNIAGSSSREQMGEGRHRQRRLDLAQIRSFFEEGGPLAQSLERYERREQQIIMADAVAEAFNDSEFLLVEAGTGTGKSLAYLVPAILWANRNGERTVVSTNTKNLQEQLFYKDLPELERVLDVPFTSVLLKGRSNYLCLNRWIRALDDPETTFTPEERKAVLSLVMWTEETTSGDIAENNGFAGTRNRSAWNKISAEGSNCIPQKCKFHNDCFMMKVRKAAQKADIVVVNHSLLFSDLSSENAVLSEYGNLVFDEAHNVEKVAAQYLGLQVDIWTIRDLINSLYWKEIGEGGSLVLLRGRLSQANLEPGQLESLLPRINSAIELCKGSWKECQSFFGGLSRGISAILRTENSGYAFKLRFKEGDDVQLGLEQQMEGFLGVLSDLSSELSYLRAQIWELPTNSFEQQDELTEEIESSIQTLQNIFDNLSFIVAAGDENYVYWLELPAKEESFDVRFMAVPLDVSEHLSTMLYSNLRTIIFTSATLSVGGDFGYLSHRLGLDREGGRLKTLQVGSPFDFEHQVMVAVPSFLPSPKSPEFQVAVNDLLNRLLMGTKRGTLVLFTSYEMLNRSYAKLKDVLSLEGTMLLGQGQDGSRSSIMSQFKDDRTSILFGTDSFWEGVDVPGEALEVLVMVKLPFAVPSEPIVAAQTEKLEREGVNPFLNYSVPEAVIKFRQGFGRLIRNTNDRGIVVILDNRVIATRYGGIFLDSLPTRHRTFRSAEDMLSTIREWFVRP